MGLEIIDGGRPITWEQFEEIAQAHIQEAKEKEASSKSKLLRHSKWIYRGQDCEAWPLDTSLERYLRAEFGIDSDTYPINKYYRYPGS